MVQKKPEEQRVRRLVLSVSAEDMQKLDELAAHPRFDGNRSKAVRWAVEIGFAVLTDESVDRVLFAQPTDALESFTMSRLESYSVK